MAITNVNKDNFKAEVLTVDKPVIVSFVTEWCGACNFLAPILTEIAEEKEDQIKIVKLNVDDEAELAKKYDIKTMPTLLIFKEGEVIAREIGVQFKDPLMAWVDAKLIHSDTEVLDRSNDMEVREAINILFSQAFTLGLVEEKENFEERLEVVSDLLENAFNSGLVSGEDFRKLQDPVAIVDEIARRKSNNDKPEDEPSMKDIFKQIGSEAKKPSTEQNEKVYFDVGRSIGNKLDKIGCKINDKTEKTQKKLRNFLMRKR